MRDDERLYVCRGEAGSDGAHRAEDVEAAAALALDLIIEFRQLESTQVKPRLESDSLSDSFTTKVESDTSQLE